MEDHRHGAKIRSSSEIKERGAGFGLLQGVADDRHFKAGIIESVDTPQLKLRRMHAKCVVAPGDYRGNRQAAMTCEFRNLSLPRPGEHVTDLPDGILDGVVELVKFRPR